MHSYLNGFAKVLSLSLQRSQESKYESFSQIAAANLLLDYLPVDFPGRDVIISR